ncbi:MAG: hypothetical protein L3K16_05815 [Thermoplasmata archaeon]|nr:hypothetical protein [Thermoplasmata archaeon]
MAPGRFTAWSVRWLPETLAIVATIQLAILLAATFVWREGPVVLVANGIVTVLFAASSALMGWSRRTPAPSSVPALAHR